MRNLRPQTLTGVWNQEGVDFPTVGSLGCRIYDNGAGLQGFMAVAFLAFLAFQEDSISFLYLSYTYLIRNLGK